MGSFAKATQAQARGDEIAFVLETGGVPRQFEISGDVLRQHFGAVDETGSELLKAFERARFRIEALAKKAQWVPSEGIITLGAGDFGAHGEIDAEPDPSASQRHG